jgi:hypothetical protein
MAQNSDNNHIYTSRKLHKASSLRSGHGRAKVTLARSFCSQSSETKHDIIPLEAAVRVGKKTTLSGGVHGSGAEEKKSSRRHSAMNRIAMLQWSTKWPRSSPLSGSPLESQGLDGNLVPEKYNPSCCLTESEP